MYYWKNMPIEERIAVRIKPNGECREWTGGMSGAKKPEHRRPVMKRGQVSRIVWELAFGPIPDGYEVCHTCDNPKCLRTSHFFLGTHIENLADMDAKGRRVFAIGERSGSAAFTEEQVRDIRCRSNVSTQAELAREFGVSKYAIWAIVQRKTWKHVA